MMRFDTSQQMRLGQQMKLAPRMIQSMEILQMPLLALQERLEQELESNIALERIEPGDDVGDGVDRDGAGESTEGGEVELVVGDNTKDSAEDFERLNDLTDTYGDMLGDDWTPPRKAATGERDAKMDAMANVAARGASLEDQLLEQWRLTEVDDRTRALGELLIGFIDSDGLLSAPIAAIVEQYAAIPGLEVDEASLERTLETLHETLEPRGIGARTLVECLLLQVDARELADPDPDPRWDLVRVLIADHFDDLVQNRMPRIASATGASIEEIQDAMGLLRRLDLSPGRDLVDDAPPPIHPDIVVDYDEEIDAFVPRISGDRLPPVRLNDEYLAMAKDKAQARETRDFLGRNVQNAQWIIDAIRQRRSTLLRVATVVCAHQRAWFDKGPQALRPLPMIDVADQLGIHVATVSRAVADKWMQTPRGVVPLRRFFSGGTQASDGTDMSWEAVRARLQEIIDAEDKTRPLSDEALSQKLKDEGISIARRTVVKYRQQLGIPAARRRKRFTA